MSGSSSCQERKGRSEVQINQDTEKVEQSSTDQELGEGNAEDGWIQQEYGSGQDQQQVSAGQLESREKSARQSRRSMSGTNHDRSTLRRILSAIHRVLTWTPPSCRYDPENPPDFTLGLNLLFSFATTATVGNLYYNQPILYKIADTFAVSYEHSSNIATLMQAGYAGGIILLCPLADVLPRRLYILSLVAITAIAWIGLCVTDSFNAFAGLSFICGFTTVTPQLMLPLVGDLAPPHRRATALAVVVSGLSLGMMVARLLAGVVANYTSWRNIYWVSFGLQAAVFVSLYFFMPDYPTINRQKDEVDMKKGVLRGVLHYCRVLYVGIAVVFFSHPTLVQACMIVFCLSAVFTSYWTTLSFLLASPPYNYPSFAIGLFGLIGIVVICLGPVYGRYVIDKIQPIVAVLLGTAVELAGVAIGVAIGTFNVGGPVIQAIFIDFGNQATNIALRSSIFTLARKAQNRVNAAYMIASFTGQLMGTSAGNHLYAQGGWRYSGGLSIGLVCFAIFISVIRGPRETGWVGWHGGWSIRRDPIPKAASTIPESRAEEGAVLAELNDSNDVNKDEKP